MAWGSGSELNTEDSGFDMKVCVRLGQQSRPKTRGDGLELSFGEPFAGRHRGHHEDLLMADPECHGQDRDPAVGHMLLPANRHTDRWQNQLTRSH
jgi:hypothetical protein